MDAKRNWNLLVTSTEFKDFPDSAPSPKPLWCHSSVMSGFTSFRGRGYRAK